MIVTKTLHDENPLAATSPREESTTASEGPLEIAFETNQIQDWARLTSTPSLLIDLRVLARRLHAIKQVVPSCDLMFAMKANSDVAVLRTVQEIDCGFDVASGQELKRLAALGVKSEAIYFSSIAKSTVEITTAAQLQVGYLAADSEAELDKIKALHPAAKILLRLLVNEPQARVPLSNRFGVSAERIAELVKYGRRNGLRIEGISVHVGSQCLNPEAWTRAALLIHEVIDSHMTCAALGGGMPIKYRAFPQVPSFPEVLRSMEQPVSLLKKIGLKVLIEPGRFVVGPAGALATSVTLVKPSTHQDRDWLFLDAGLYNALHIASEGFDFDIVPISATSGPKRSYDICGPSCHSRDTFQRPIVLPEQKAGDRLLLLSAGAYTLPFVSPFCGNPSPVVETLFAEQW